MFGSEYGFHGSYIFDDGSFGYIVDPEFYPGEFEHLDDAQYIDDELYLNGRHALGNLYIDRYLKDGTFIQGGCFIYFEGETMRDYCDRNGEPYPVKRIPDEVIEVSEGGEKRRIARQIRR